LIQTEGAGISAGPLLEGDPAAHQPSAAQRIAELAAHVIEAPLAELAVNVRGK